MPRLVIVRREAAAVEPSASVACVVAVLLLPSAERRIAPFQRGEIVSVRQIAEPTKRLPCGSFGSSS